MPVNDYAYLSLRYSGGAANTDPDLSLGGAISAERVPGQGFTASSIGGTSVIYAAGNAPGAGTLFYDVGNNTLAWLEFEGLTGDPVNVDTDGRYILESGTGYIIVDVTNAGLPAGDSSGSITITEPSNNALDDVSKAESWAGDVNYRCVYLQRDTGGGILVGGKIYINSDASGPDTIAIGVDPAGLNSAPATIANESTAPAGVTFTAPASAATGLSVGDFNTAGDYYAIWIRRTVAAQNNVSAPLSLSSIGIEIY